MRTLLILGTAAEIVLLVVVLVVYLVLIQKSLRRSADSLADVTWGVRAVESMAAPVGPSVTKINGQLQTISGALSGLADLAEGDGAGRAGTGSRGG